MTTKDKAIDLIDKMIISSNNVMLAKECALVAVNEIIIYNSQYNGMHDQEYFDSDLKYWKEVKKEIEKL
jgi:hypothetical protein